MNYSINLLQTYPKVFKQKHHIVFIFWNMEFYLFSAFLKSLHVSDFPEITSPTFSQSLGTMYGQTHRGACTLKYLFSHYIEVGTHLHICEVSFQNQDKL